MIEPQRLKDLDPEAAALFRAAADYRAPRGMQQRLLRALIVPVAIGAPAATAWAVVASKALIVACGAAVTIGAAGGVVAYRHHRASSLAAVVDRPVPAARSAARVRPSLEMPAPAIAEAAPALGSAPAPAQASRVPRTASVARARTIAISPAPAPATAPAPMPAPALPSEQPAPPSDALAGELSLLGAAAAALHDGDPARAQRVLDEYGRAFAGGALGDEALVLRIAARGAQGDRAQARAEGEAFLRWHPDSVFGARVRSMLNENERAPTNGHHTTQ